MSFYERYAGVCMLRGMDPCGQRTADLIGSTRAAISIWGKKQTVPKGETVAAIADALRVSSDYLLGRTDDPTDFADPVERAKLQNNDLMRLYEQLSDVDRIRAEAYMQGLLATSKASER